MSDCCFSVCEGLSDATFGFRNLADQVCRSVHHLTRLGIVRLMSTEQIRRESPMQGWWGHALARAAANRRDKLTSGAGNYESATNADRDELVSEPFSGRTAGTAIDHNKSLWAGSSVGKCESPRRRW
jgi:hypothetical protein